jgi:hypothetical protein
VAECDKFFRQVGNDPFGAAVKTRRNALYEWSHLCNFHDHIYFPPALHNAGSATKFHFRPIGNEETRNERAPPCMSGKEHAEG